jgi:hypothetical protein
MEYHEWRDRVVKALEAAATAHEAADFAKISSGHKELDAAVPRNSDSRYDKLLIALDFWSGWIDARNHDWLYYRGFSAADWPALARRLLQDLRDNHEIGDERVLERFDSRRRRRYGASIWTRVRGLLRGPRAV